MVAAADDHVTATRRSSMPHVTIARDFDISQLLVAASME
jgi:hypothetical protein